ncbi:MAG TPA: ArsC/Spx/MgsR family protein [Flavobacterium sp.]
MDRIFYISSCDTCRKIIKSLPNSDKLTFRDIKQAALTATEVEEMRQLSGSYESLFSKKAQLYKSLGLKDKTLTEEDYKKYILQHYTFLSRPVFIIDSKIFVGNSSNNVTNVISALS